MFKKLLPVMASAIFFCMLTTSNINANPTDDFEAFLKLSIEKSNISSIKIADYNSKIFLLDSTKIVSLFLKSQIETDIFLEFLEPRLKAANFSDSQIAISSEKLWKILGRYILIAIINKDEPATPNIKELDICSTAFSEANRVQFSATIGFRGVAINDSDIKISAFFTEWFYYKSDENFFLKDIKSDGKSIIGFVSGIAHNVIVKYKMENAKIEFASFSTNLDDEIENVKNTLDNFVAKRVENIDQVKAVSRKYSSVKTCQLTKFKF